MPSAPTSLGEAYDSLRRVWWRELTRSAAIPDGEPQWTSDEVAQVRADLDAKYGRTTGAYVHEPRTDFSPNWARDRLKGASGD